MLTYEENFFATTSMGSCVKKYEKRQRLKEKYELENQDLAINSNDTAGPTSLLHEEPNENKL